MSRCEDDALPGIETVERFDGGTPRYCRCAGCGASGPSAVGLDTDIPAILHDQDCARADR